MRILITGAASGIGAACAARFTQEGATVVTLDLTGVVDHQVDVRDEAAVAAVVDALLPLLRVRDCGTTLSPRHFRRRMARPVSYYALLKWWLLLSQHPGCHRNPTSFRTERDLGTLAGDLGCSPLDYEAYPPQSICRC